MIDTETQEPIVVHVEGDGGPYVMVPLDQLPDVQRVLDASRLSYRIAEDAIGLEGRPVIAIVDFGVGADAPMIQRALDAA